MELQRSANVDAQAGMLRVGFKCRQRFKCITSLSCHVLPVLMLRWYADGGICQVTKLIVCRCPSTANAEGQEKPQAAREGSLYLPTLYFEDLPSAIVVHDYSRWADEDWAQLYARAPMLFAWHTTARVNCAQQDWGVYFEDHPHHRWIEAFWSYWDEMGTPQMPLPDTSQALLNGGTVTFAWLSHTISALPAAVRALLEGGPPHADPGGVVSAPPGTIAQPCPLECMLQNGTLPSLDGPFQYDLWSQGGWQMLYAQSAQLYAWHFMKTAASWDDAAWSAHQAADPAHYEVLMGFSIFWQGAGPPQEPGPCPDEPAPSPLHPQAEDSHHCGGVEFAPAEDQPAGWGPHELASGFWDGMQSSALPEELFQELDRCPEQVQVCPHLHAESSVPLRMLRT